jgi:hypothetical protein
MDALLPVSFHDRGIGSPIGRSTRPGSSEKQRREAAVEREAAVRQQREALDAGCEAPYNELIDDLS